MNRDAAIEEYFPIVHALLHKRGLHDSPEAYDAAVDALLSAVDSHDPSQAKLSSWVYTKIAYGLLDFKRTLARRASRLRIFSFDAPLPGGEMFKGIMADDVKPPSPDRLRMTAALAILTPRQRAVIEGYYYHGLTMLEVANRLGVTKARVSQVHSEALTRLHTHAK